MPVNKSDKPSINLFSYATGELSQDAIICWLIAWSDSCFAETNPQLHETGRELVYALLSKHNEAKLPIGPLSVRIYRQLYKMDVVVVVNESQVLLIEDKVHTSDHSGQLNRYREKLERTFSDKRVIPIYFKTGDQSDYGSAEDANYGLFLRDDLLKVLRSGKARGVRSEIYLSFHEHLELIESGVNSYAILSLKTWKGTSWIGFFKEVKESIPNGKWSYVPNPSGGFMAFWWCHNHFVGGKAYLQMQKETLCFKINVENKDDRRMLRGSWNKTIVEIGKMWGVSLRKPNRYGLGKTMTVAQFDGDFRVAKSNGLLDMDKTLDVLKMAEKVLITAAKSMVDKT